MSSENIRVNSRLVPDEAHIPKRSGVFDSRNGYDYNMDKYSRVRYRQIGLQHRFRQDMKNIDKLRNKLEISLEKRTITCESAMCCSGN